MNPFSSGNDSVGTRLIDNTGASYGVKQVDGKPRVSSMPYLYDIAEGNVTGHTAWSKIGFNGAIGTTEEDIWVVGGSYVWPTVAQQMEVISDSAEDDYDKAPAAGTGVKDVIIFYLDGNLIERTETLRMNGTAAVATTATNIYRVQGFRALTTGTTGAAVGTISLRFKDPDTHTPIYSQIAPKYSRARNITYTVPAGKVLYVTSTKIGVYGATKGIRVTTRSDYSAEMGGFMDHFYMNSEYLMGNGIFYSPFEIPTKLIAGTRMKTSAIADAAGALVSVAHRGWLETAA